MTPMPHTTRQADTRPTPTGAADLHRRGPHATPARVRSGHRQAVKLVTLVAVAACAVAVWLAPPPTSDAQVIQLQVRGPAQNQAAAAADDDSTIRTPAQVDTSPDADALMGRVQTFLEAERNREALLVLQLLVDDYGHTQTLTDYGVYIPVRRVVNQMFATWADPRHPRHAVYQMYLVTADAAAEALVGAQPLRCRDEQALRAVTDRYLMSRLGDEAAFALGCLQLDRGNPTGAVEAFELVVDGYPDAARSVSEPAALERLGVAAARMADRRTAERALARLREAGAGAAAIGRVSDQIERIDVAGQVRSTDRWTMDLGGPGRDGLMPGPPVSQAQGKSAMWVALWQVDVEQPIGDGVQVDRSQTRRLKGHSGQATGPMEERWREHGWTPTTQAVFADGRMYFKSGYAVVGVDLTTGEQLWRANDPGEQNGARGEIMSASVLQRRSRTLTAVYPSSLEEAALFGNRVGRELSLDDDRLYHIDGESGNGVRSVNGRRVRANPGSGVVVPANDLVAVELDSGRELWRTSVPSRLVDNSAGVGEQPAQAVEQQQQPQADETSGTRCVAAPIPYGRTVLTVVEDRDELHLVALDRDNGQLVWRRFLCAASFGVAPPWSPVGMVLDGRTLYIVTGRGLVISADAASGALRWSTPHRRRALEGMSHPSLAARRWLEAGMAWSEHAALVVGGTLVVTAADAEPVLRFEKLSGRPLPSLPLRDQVTTDDSQWDYLLGTLGGNIYVGGAEEVACFDAQSGRLQWRAPQLQSLGRPLLTAEGVFAPTEQGLVSIDPATGRRTGQWPVSDWINRPLGNLYSDGQRLLAAGPTGVVALADARVALASIDDPLHKANIYAQLGQPAQAMASLREAWDKLPPGQRRQQVGAALLDEAIARLEQNPDPAEALQLLEEAEPFAITPGDRARLALAQTRWAEAVGQTDQLASSYWNLATGQRPVLIKADPDQPGWQVSSAELATSRLAELAAAGTFDLADQFGPFSELADGAEPVPTERLYLAARLEAPMGGGEALAALIDRAGSDNGKDPALALLALEELAREPTNVFDARLALAEAYTQRDWPRLAAEQWRQAHRLMGNQPAATDGAVRMIDERLAESTAAAQSDAAMAGVRLEPAEKDRAYRLYKAVTDPNAHLFYLDDGDPLDTSGYLRDHALLYLPAARRVTRVRPSKGFEAGGSFTVPDDAEALASGGTDKTFAGGADGHVAVIAGPGYAQAYDLLTMQPLWRQQRPRHLQAASQRHNWPALQRNLVQTTDVGHGVFAEVDYNPEDRVFSARVSDAVTGKVLWTYAPPGEVVRGVSIQGDVVVLATGQWGERLLVCDRRTGRLQRTTQLNVRGTRFYVAWLPRGLAYVSSVGSVEFAPIDDRTQAWTIQRGGARPSTMLPVGEHQVLVCWSDARMQLIDSRTGKQVWLTKSHQLGRYAYEADLDARGKTLGMVTRDRRNQWVYLEADLASGEALRQVMFGKKIAPYRTNARTLARSGPLLPLIQRGRNYRDFKVELRRRTNGKIAGEPIKTAGGDLSTSLFQSPVIRDGVVLLPTQAGLLAMRPVPEDKTSDPVRLAPDGGDGGNGGNGADQQAQAQAPGGNVRVNINGQQMQIRIINGQAQVQMPNGGQIRGKNIRINNIQIQAQGGGVIIRGNNAPADQDDDGEDAADPADADDPADQAEPQPQPQPRQEAQE